MPSIGDTPDEERDALLVRLGKIEGHAQHMQRMVEAGRNGLDLLPQAAAMRAAADALLEAVALCCLRHPDELTSPEDALAPTVYLVIHGGR